MNRIRRLPRRPLTMPVDLPDLVAPAAPTLTVRRARPVARLDLESIASLSHRHRTVEADGHEDCSRLLARIHRVEGIRRRQSPVLAVLERVVGPFAVVIALLSRISMSRRPALRPSIPPRALIRPA